MFTDEDLARLKEWLKNPKFTHSTMVLPDSMIEIQSALLSRLEAGERCADALLVLLAWARTALTMLVELSEEHEITDNEGTKTRLRKAIEHGEEVYSQWRKEKGK